MEMNVESFTSPASLYLILMKRQNTRRTLHECMSALHVIVMSFDSFAEPRAFVCPVRLEVSSFTHASYTSYAYMHQDRATFEVYHF